MLLNKKINGFLSKTSFKSYTSGLIISSIIFFELIIVIGGWKYKPDLVNSENLSLKMK